MANDDHAGYKKIQCWIPEQLWDKIASLNYPNQTSAVTEAFNALLDKSQNIPTESPDIPALMAQIEGLQMLLSEKQERINDLKKENERLDFYALYFKSQDYKRLEQSTEESKPEVQVPVRSPVSKARSTSVGKPVIKKVCKECGEEFDALSPKAETCSSKCRAAFYRKSRKER